MAQSLSSIFEQKPTKDIKKEIVEELLNSEKNLYEKTELKKPLQWSCLRSMKSFIEDNNLPESSKILEAWIKQAHKFLISSERKGRGEYIEALKALGKMDEKDEESKIKEKLGV